VSRELTPAAIRAELAKRRILKYEFASLIGVHPQRLGAVLNERAPLTPELATRIERALGQRSPEGPRAR